MTILLTISLIAFVCPTVSAFITYQTGITFIQHTAPQSVPANALRNNYYLSPPPPSTSLLHVSNNNNNNNKNDDDENNNNDDDIDRSLFDKIAQDFLENGGSLPQQRRQTDFPSLFPPPNPFGSNLDKLRGKANPYDDDELMGVLQTHNRLRAEEIVYGDDDDDNEGKDDDVVPLSLHDLVTRAIEEEEKDDFAVTTTTATPPKPTPKNIPLPKTWDDIPTEMQTKIHKITTIASDIDGTILTSNQTIHPRTHSAIRRAIDIVSPPKRQTATTTKPTLQRPHLQHFFLATGKSRQGALNSFGSELASLLTERNIPGVYLQGLYCVDGDGTVVFERKLEREAIAAVESLLLGEMEDGNGTDGGVSLVGYDGDDLYTTKVTDIVTHLHEHYNEPLPRLLPPLPKQQDDSTATASEAAVRNLSSHTPSLHKLLFLSNNTTYLSTVLRPRLEKLITNNNNFSHSPPTITQALPTMLELLPSGCDKGVGVGHLCAALGVKNVGEELLALGDAENDVGMLEMAGVGVAMGNGSLCLKEVSDFMVVEGNDGGGVGVVLDRLVLDFYEEGEN